MDLHDTTPGGTLTGQLCPVTVSAYGVDSWTATVSATIFTTDGGAPTPAIANGNLSYWSGPATTRTGTGTVTPGQATVAQAQPLDTGRTAFSLESGTTLTTTTWNPTITVTVPASAVAGHYTGTVTHSVA